jgi:antitoxin component YwqK of YwqJK toxin-antitoxin module
MKHTLILLLFSCAAWGQVSLDSVYFNKKYIKVGNAIVTTAQGSRYEFVYLGDSIFCIYTYNIYKNSDSLVTTHYTKLSDTILINEGQFIQYSKGKPVLTYFYKAGKMEGLFYEFFDNGHIKVQTYMENFLEEGAYFEYYKSGKIKAIGNMQKGTKVNKWKYFYESGQLEKCGNYLLIELTKLNEEQYIDFINDWKNNYVSVKVGDWIYYKINQKLSHIESYKNGKLLK